MPREGSTLWRRDYGDLAVNLAGFSPLGFLASRYGRFMRPHRRLAAAGFALLVGGGLSLMIELEQVWLPTRVSSATDLILNTIGTGLGVLMAVWAKG